MWLGVESISFSRKIPKFWLRTFFALSFGGENHISPSFGSKMLPLPFFVVARKIPNGWQWLGGTTEWSNRTESLNGRLFHHLNNRERPVDEMLICRALIWS